MKNLALLAVLFFTSCAVAPAHATVEGITGAVKECSSKSYKYSLLVRYKDAMISPEEVINVVAPRLNLPRGWEKSIDRVVYEIYGEDLTQDEVFNRLYVRCIHGYSI